ncbi:aminoglycoside 6-adenylyltransferase [Paenibacillus tuaregi]|uniref:aminoglycoside 6-adenylyltransferase n=1 Tax=Paenibacillus tuaregi TaxID=1816681 RepID=UPI000A40B6AC|nr:aminoglycoside 6-adenylyltransferase [Paenibacillus tuaregi]
MPDELPYAKLIFEHTSWASLDQMVNWWIGIRNDFLVYDHGFIPELAAEVP